MRKANVIYAVLLCLWIVFYSLHVKGEEKHLELLVNPDYRVVDPLGIDREIVYITLGPDKDAFRIELLDLRTNESRLLYKGKKFADVVFHRFTPSEDGKILYFPDEQLRRFDIATGKLSNVTHFKRSKDAFGFYNTVVKDVLALSGGKLFIITEYQVKSPLGEAEMPYLCSVNTDGTDLKTIVDFNREYYDEDNVFIATENSSSFLKNRYLNALVKIDLLTGKRETVLKGFEGREVWNGSSDGETLLLRLLIPEKQNLSDILGFKTDKYINGIQEFRARIFLGMLVEMFSQEYPNVTGITYSSKFAVHDFSTGKETMLPQEIVSPELSNSGRFIAFSKDCHAVYVSDADGSHVCKIIDIKNSVDVYYPYAKLGGIDYRYPFTIWSPDDRFLIGSVYGMKGNERLKKYFVADLVDKKIMFLPEHFENLVWLPAK